MKTKKYTKRRTWLESRKGFVGASETPTLFGVGYATSSIQGIYQEKVDPPQYTDDEEEIPEHFTLGLCLQDGIIDAAKRRPECKGLEILPNRIGMEGCLVFHHDKKDHIAFTPDAMIHPRIPVEVKNIGHWNKGDWEDGATPLIYQVQLQHQMLVTGADWGMLIACMAGQSLEIRKIEKNPEFHAKMLDRIDKFWGMVVNRQMPPVDASEATKKALAAIYPQSDKFAVELPLHATQWIQARKAAKALGGYCDQVATEAENRLKACLQEADAGIAPDGSVVKWGNVNYKAKTCPHCNGVLKEASKGRRFTTPKALPKGLDTVPCTTDVSKMTGGQPTLDFDPVAHYETLDES